MHIRTTSNLKMRKIMLSGSTSKNNTYLTVRSL